MTNSSSLANNLAYLTLLFALIVIPRALLGMIIGIPLLFIWLVRIATIWLQRRFIKGESAMGSLRVATALTPTPIFTMVLAAILRERFHIADSLYGALLVYAALSTLLPSLHDDRCGRIDQNAHRTPRAPDGASPRETATTFCAASASVSADMMGRPHSATIRLPSSTLVPARRTTSGTRKFLAA
jgi:hypothetical protein